MKKPTMTLALGALLLAPMPAPRAQATPCVSMNWGGTLRYTTSNVYEFAIQATNGSSMLVFDRLEFYTRAILSPQNVTIRIYDAAGPMSNGKLLTSGPMSIGTTLTAYSAKFATPAVVPANTTFWISFDSASYIYMPTSLPGVTQTHYWRGTSGWNGPFSGTWNYRLYCAQQAVFTTYGQGCAGSAGCRPDAAATRNWNESLASTTTKAKKIGLLEMGLASNSPPVCGFAMRCRSRAGSVQVQVSAHEGVFQGSRLVPGTLLGSATMPVGDKVADYTAAFSKPFSVPPSQLLMLVFDPADQLVVPVATKGTGGLHSEYDGNGWSTLMTGTPWIYSVHTMPARPVPELAAEGRPVLGQSFSVVLSNARTTSPGLFFLGFSDKTWGPLPLPLSLAPRAPGCMVLASGDVILNVLTDGFGSTRVPLQVPSSPALAGASFYVQFHIYDPAANALAMVASNAGKATIDKY